MTTSVFGAAPDSYARRLEAQEAERAAQLDAQNEADWAARALEPMDKMKVMSSFSVGNEPAAIPTDWGNVAGAGMQAAGQAAAAIAQAAAAKAKQDAWVQGNMLDRATSERMARASLTQSGNQFDSSNQMTAYDRMLAALSGSGNNTMQQRALSRSNSNNRSDGLTTSYLG
jgi:hypothetical protein